MYMVGLDGHRDGEGGLPGGLGEVGGAVGDGRLLGRGGVVEDLRHLAPRHVRPVEAERGEDEGCDDVMKARAPPQRGLAPRCRAEAYFF